MISGGALFSTLSGSTITSTAMLAETMIPEKRARGGYKKSMILGPMVGVGGLAMSTPPFGMLLFVMKGSAPPGDVPG